jgi:peptide deformylase
VDELLQVVRAHNGAGLAAPQIGYPLRIFVNAYSHEVDEEGYALCLEQPEIYINPVVTRFSKRKFTASEGCLSVPGVSAMVERAYEIEIEYTNLKGERVKGVKETHWRAKCIQHEIDHLNGVLYFDHLSEKEIQKIKAALLKVENKTLTLKRQVVMPEDFLN